MATHPPPADSFSLPALSPKSSAVLFSTSATALAAAATAVEGVVPPQQQQQQHPKPGRRDISHLRDGGRQTAQRQAGSIPPTLIPEQYHVKEDVVAPQSGVRDAVFDEKTRVWKTTVFPSLRPTSRQEVLLLEQWLNRMLLDLQQKSLGPIEAVKEAQKLYAISFNEILRQVYVACSERGQLLEKIWTRYLQLFEHVLKIRERERAQFNQKLQQQMQMYQQLYQDKDEAFNNVYLQLATEKEKLQMAKDKLERSVLLLREDFRRRNRKEAKMKKVIAHLKAKEATAEAAVAEGAPVSSATTVAAVAAAAAVDDGASYSDDELLLPADISDEFFAANNLLIVQRLQFIESRLRVMKGEIPQEQVDANYGTMLELDSLLGTLSDTISSLAEASAAEQLPVEFSRRQQAVAAASATSTGHSLDKASQTTSADMRLGSLPSPFFEFWSQGARAPRETVNDKAWLIAHINAIYAHKIVMDEEDDSADRRRVPLAEAVYNFFVALYGTRNTAEGRIADLFATVDAVSGSSPRALLFHKLCSGAYTAEDVSFFLYTLAQFFEGPESEIVLHDAADGTQWITIECAKLMIDSTFRDQEQEVRDDLARACEAASLQGRVDFDLFMAAMLDRCHALGESPEEQLSLLFSTSFSGGSFLSFGEFSSLMRSFGGSDMSERKIHKMYRRAVDDFEQESRRPQAAAAQSRAVLASIIKVARKHGLLSWKAFPPTKVDRKKVSEQVFSLLSLLWFNLLADSVQRLAGSLSSLTESPEAAQAKQAIADAQEEFTQRLEAKESAASAIEAFRHINELLTTGQAVLRQQA